jgi:hypothetical protein
LGSILPKSIGKLAEPIASEPAMNGFMSLDRAFRMHDHLLVGPFDAVEFDWITETVVALGTILWLWPDINRCMKEFLVLCFAGA